MKAMMHDLVLLIIPIIVSGLTYVFLNIATLRAATEHMSQLYDRTLVRIDKRLDRIENKIDGIKNVRD